MSQLGFTVFLSLVLLPFAETTSLNRSRAAILSAQLAPTTPKQAFHRNIHFEGEEKTQDPFLPSSAEEASADLLSPPAPSFYSLASKLLAPARHVANSARRVGRYLLTGERQMPQQQQQQQQQQQRQPQPLRASMRLGTPPSPRVGPQFGRLLAQGLQPGLTPSTKGKLSEIAQRYKPSDETAAAIAAASRARAAAAPRAAHQPPAAAAEGKGALAGAREFGVNASGVPRQGFTADDFKLKDMGPRLKKAETEAVKRKEEEAKRQKEEEHKRREEEMRKESEREKERQRREEEERERKAREEAERREAERKKEAEERQRQEQEKKRKEEAERQRKREEEEARKKKETEEREKREAERKQKEADERKKKEEERRKKNEEEQRRKPEAERQKKEEETKRKEEADKTKAKETLTSKLQQRATLPVSRQPFGEGKSVEELKKLADQMFAEVDEEARRNNQFTQAPLPEFISSDFISEEEKKAAANPTIDPTITKEHMERAMRIIKDVAQRYSTETKYFPTDNIELQSAVNDNPQFGCHTMTTKWSPCSTTCGHGGRMRLTRAMLNNKCMTTAERETCISSTGCKDGLQFLTSLERPIKGLPPDAMEELGRLMTKSAKIVKKPESNEACIVFDTGFTGRAYTKEGVMGQFGIGYQYRLYKTFDNSCTGSLENRVVNRIEKLTMDEFRKTMLERHNSIRRQHSVADLKWNPLIAANMLHYLKQQDQYEECRMEHSPGRHRQLPGFNGPIGENLYTCCAFGGFPRNVPNDWASEAHCYRYGRIGNPCTGILGPKCSIEDHAEGLMTGHFTATVWNKSTEVGCAYVVCSKACSHERPLMLVGCQYFPAGNIVGKTPFSKDAAEKLHMVYPQMLPEAAEDPEQIKSINLALERVGDELRLHGYLGLSKYLQSRVCAPLD
ncbi:Allergen V5/Tpx-1-related family protein, related [Eimeria maxima]|uniref:Allergen V5/Tpx-1-related family protein, related n=1 Tax=Eimeria maxima TaxID=5804 RepID=U6MBI8_EIMMA|nr:Allergen V5/Tpx-1-related family protein, related [Eimeria maxima]CDJ61411.1 Allergen V5/Tpx-1-related family protein, related [Eimeria maxima]